MNKNCGSDKDSFWKSKSGITTFAFLGIAGILLIFEHHVQLLEWMPYLPYLPYLLLLACPLLHVFMHGGHSGHGHGGSPPASKDTGARHTPGN